MTPQHEPEVIEANKTAGNWRCMGCNNCSRPFGKHEPFLHHETDGSVGGPFCIDCAPELGLRDDPYRHWIFHPGDEP